MKKTNKLYILILFIFVLINCNNNSNNKVILIIIDGMDFQVTKSLIESSVLKNFKHIKDNGIFNNLKTIIPTLSPAIWTTIITGYPPNIHGIDNAKCLNKNGEVFLKQSSDRRCKALWNVLTENDIENLNVGWLITYKAEKVKGIMISEKILFQELPNRTYPTSLSNLVDSTLFETQKEEYPYKFLANENIRKRFYENYYSDITKYKLFLELYDRKIHKFACLGLKGVDFSEHCFFEKDKIMSLFTKMKSEVLITPMEIVLSYYFLVDEMIGKILALLDDDTILFIVSDHGFEYPAHANGPDGVLFIYGKEIKPTKLEKSTIYDIFPNISYLLELPIPLDIEGKIFYDIYKNNHAVLNCPSNIIKSKLNVETKLPENIEKDIKDELKSLGYIE